MTDSEIEILCPYCGRRLEKAPSQVMIQCPRCRTRFPQDVSGLKKTLEEVEECWHDAWMRREKDGLE